MEENSHSFSHPHLLFNTVVFLLTALIGFVVLQHTNLLSQHDSKEVLAAKIVVTPTPSATPTPTATPTPSPTPLPTATPTPSPTPIPTADPTNDAIWDRLAQCEAGGNWAEDTGNGYYGGLQFNQSAWNGVGGSGNPAQASRTEQISRGKMLQAQRGWSPWGECSRQLGFY